MADWFDHGDDIGIEGAALEERLAVAVMAACQLATGKARFPPLPDDFRPKDVTIVIPKASYILGCRMVADWAARHPGTLEILKNPAEDELSHAAVWVAPNGGDGLVMFRFKVPDDEGPVIDVTEESAFDHTNVWKLDAHAIISHGGAVQRIRFTSLPKGPTFASIDFRETVPKDADPLKKALVALFGARLRPFLLLARSKAKAGGEKPSRCISLRELLDGHGGKKWPTTPTIKDIAVKNPTAVQRMRETVPNGSTDFKGFIKWLSDNGIPGVWYRFKDGSGDRFRLQRTVARQEVMVEFEPGGGDVEPTERHMVRNLVAATARPVDPTEGADKAEADMAKADEI